MPGPVTPATILLVPSDGDPHGLLAEGVCGARVPWAYHEHVAGGVHQWTMATARSIRQPRAALVLAYQGKPVPEGCGRAALRISGPDCLGAYIRRGDQCESAGTGRWWIDSVHPSVSEGTVTHTVSYGDYGAERPVSMPRPAGVAALLDVWALGAIAAARLGARLVLLDSDGHEVTP